MSQSKRQRRRPWSAKLQSPRDPGNTTRATGVVVMPCFAGREVMRVDERECFVDEDGGVNEQTLPQKRAGQRVGVTLADAAELPSAV